LEKLCSTSPKAQKLHDEVAHAMLSCPPFSLGFPSHLTQSAYYPGSSTITKDEIAAVSKVLEERSIFPENTRIRKIQETEISIFEVIQASVQTDDQPLEFSLPNSTILEDQNVVLKEYDPTCEGVIKSWAERGV
jgi:dipeptidyl-peptidase-3